VPQTGNILDRPHPAVWRRSFHTESAAATVRLNTFWHKVLRWTTNCFSATPTRILAVESCLPPSSLLISQRQRIGAIQVVCSPPEVNPATAHLQPSFPSLSAHRARDSSMALPTGLTSVYLHLHWKTPRPAPPPLGTTYQ